MGERWYQGGKRYNAYSGYLKQRFGGRVIKIPLNAGMTCPNRDGTKGIGGCAFCSGALSGDFAGDPAEPIEIQYERVREAYSSKWTGRCIPYFQAGTNTHAPVDKLRELFFKAAQLKDAVGVAIATRADCIDPEKAKMLGELARQTYLTVELGLQTVHDETAERVNRCHTWEEFLRGYEMLREQGVSVVIHLINGLPGETGDMMRESAYRIGQLRPHGVKLHLLHILKNTPLAEPFEKGELREMERDEYVSIICDQLELLPGETVIERLTGDGPRDLLLGPMWSRDKRRVLNMIEQELKRRDSWQGKKLEEEKEAPKARTI